MIICPLKCAALRIDYIQSGGCSPIVSMQLNNTSAECLRDKTEAGISIITLSIEIYWLTISHKVITKKSHKNEIIKFCNITLNELALNNKVTLNWLPGHEGNEREDQLAKLRSLKNIKSPLL